MKALTVLQPWASLIVAGAKHFETRSWKTNHRGPLLIHAGRKLQTAAKNLAAIDPFYSALKAAGIASPSELPVGAIIGVVQLEDCVPTDQLAHDGKLTKQENCFGDFRPGRWAWQLSQPEPIERYQYQGILGLFDVPDIIAEQLKKVMLV